MKTVLRFEKRMEEREALDVIPVIVGDQDVRVDAFVALLCRPAIAEHAQTGATIENELRAVGSDKLKARRIPAVAPGVALRRRRGAAHAPKGQLRNMLGHEWVNRDACAYAIPRVTRKRMSW